MGDETDDTLGARRNERATLTGALDWYRAVVEHKVLGLSHADATRVMTKSGLSPLGIVQHLGWAERGWFQETVAGEEVEGLDMPADDNALEFAIEPGATIESVVAFYRAESARSRAITDAVPSLETLSARASPWRGRVSLRWVLVHMLEETARHAGHLDLMREEIDGQTGD